MSWFKDAACTSAPLEWFFPTTGGSYKKGKEVCAKCPVRDECLAYNLNEFTAKDDEHGLWGGLTPSERRGMRQGRKKAKRCEHCGRLFSFVLVSSEPMYCSNECRQDVYRERKRREWRLRTGRWVA